MPQAVREASKEYWRPVNLQAERIVKPLTTHSLCPSCEAEYPIGAQFCHVCGHGRDPSPVIQAPVSLLRLLDMEQIRQRLSLSVGSLVFFLAGLTCLIGALLTGVVYRASTVLDWQAVQIWRGEWLLAAIAFMLAGLLLKKKEV